MEGEGKREKGEKRKEKERFLFLFFFFFLGKAELLDGSISASEKQVEDDQGYCLFILFYFYFIIYLFLFLFSLFLFLLFVFFPLFSMIDSPFFSSFLFWIDLKEGEYHITTFGAPSAHTLKYKNGGLRFFSSFFFFLFSFFFLSFFFSFPFFSKLKLTFSGFLDITHKHSLQRRKLLLNF